MLPGDRIAGRWNGRAYRVEQKLGEGANGQVYLVTGTAGLCALKIGYDTLDLQSEINGLLELQLGPGGGSYVLDTDDMTLRGQEYPYYVMRYVQGVSPSRFLTENGMDWYPVIGYRLLTKLSELHERGYIFGDLKSDNILVSGYGTTELIDYGGLTRFGKAVRQYTELYDRGYWRAGARSADAGYDLFAFAVLCMELADSSGHMLARLASDPERNAAKLVRLLEQLPACSVVSPVLRACLTGRMRSAEEARAAWRSCVYAAGADHAAGHNSPPAGLTAILTATFLATVAVFGAALYWTFG